MAQVPTLLRRFLEHYDPVHRGWTPAGIAHGVCATNGYFFPRVRGGYLLRRAVGRVPDLSEPPVGAAGADAVCIRTFPWVAHEPGAMYVYRLTAVGGGGVETDADAVTAMVACDAAGRWSGPRPNAPADLRVDAVSGGRFALRWTYGGEGEQIGPDHFTVHNDAGGGEINLAEAAGVVAARCGRVHYAWTSPGFADGLRVRWMVCAVSAVGVATLCPEVVAALADARAPHPAPAVLLSRVDEEGR